MWKYGRANGLPAFARSSVIHRQYQRETRLDEEGREGGTRERERYRAREEPRGKLRREEVQEGETSRVPGGVTRRSGERETIFAQPASQPPYRLKIDGDRQRAGFILVYLRALNGSQRSSEVPRTGIYREIYIGERHVEMDASPCDCDGFFCDMSRDLGFRSERAR